MRTLLVVAIVAAAAPVSAGTYVGLGIGTGASVSDSMNTMYATDGRSGRLAVGFSFGRAAIEGAYTGYSLVMGGGGIDSQTFQVALKYNLPLADHFEAFGRGGLLRTDLNSKDGGTSSSGDGFTSSAGLEYRLPAFGSVFLDYTHNQASFADNGGLVPLDQTASMWTVGLNISL